MTTTNDDLPSLPERIYRLRLLEGLTIATRDGYAAEPREVMEDLIRLRQELPYPESAQDWGEMTPAVRSIMERCQSEAIRNMDPGTLGMIICVAHLSSRLPYVPTIDELGL
jgi:hypothetical protein